MLSFVEKMFRRLEEYQTPVWIISFPEGTRIRPKKLARSQEFARARGLPLLENVLLPRSRGFIATLTHMRNSVDGVYDLTIGYPHGIPSIRHYAMGIMSEVHLHVRRYPSASLPLNREEQEAWLLQRFQEKDRLMAHFLRHKRFT